uniref:Uncharacterized protein n=1 Tax=Anguilla anguilla TaxID=7936 RepID=A0A0E9S0Z5_ANGAN
MRSSLPSGIECHPVFSAGPSSPPRAPPPMRPPWRTLINRQLTSFVL